MLLILKGLMGMLHADGREMVDVQSVCPEIRVELRYT